MRIDQVLEVLAKSSVRRGGYALKVFLLATQLLYWTTPSEATDSCFCSSHLFGCESGDVVCDDSGCDSLTSCPNCGSAAGSGCCGGGCLCGPLYECLADSGITLSSNLTQFYFGTTSGGLEQSDRYGGHGDYVANINMEKLGVHKGLFLKLRAEHRIGESITEDAGVFLPPTLAAELPTNVSRELYLTNVLFTQFLSESFGVYAGKLDTLDGDANAYASGRGITQFSNVAFIANPIALRTIPYASLGCGFVVLQEGQPLFNFLVINPTNTTRTSGFNQLFRDGVALSAELRIATQLCGRPGHQLFAGTWSSKDYVSLGQDPRVALPNITIDRASDSWSLYWNTDQALWVDPCNPKRHWGYFARAGVADNSANPISYLLSAGLGGASPLSDKDTFGLGYYHLGTSDKIGPIIQTFLGPIGDGQGVELFYRRQITQSLSITPDFQWLDPARQNVADAYILGLRANLRF